MAQTKEAIAIVLDVGSSMNNTAADGLTYFETSLNAINMILQRKLFSESKDEVALVLLGSTDTANDLAADGDYQNITVARPCGAVDWNILTYIQNDIQPTDLQADFLEALIVSMDHLVKSIQGKRGFGSKRIILFSDLAGEFADHDLDNVIAGMKQQEIEFNVIGPDLDDDDDDDDDDSPRPGTSSGSERKPLTEQQQKAHTLLKQMIKEVDGETYSFAEALPALSYFQTRQVRPTAWKCQLTLGSELAIPIAGYQKVKEAKVKSYKNVYAKDPDATVQRVRTYHLNDEEETEVEREDTLDGHRYGSTLVPFSSEDKDAMKFRATKCLKLLCFTKQDHIKKSMILGDSTMVVIAEKGDESAAVALSALINALYETNSAAVVRRVYSAAGGPKIGCLVPHIKADYECLFYNELPFTEDCSQFTFNPLPIKDEKNTGNLKNQPTAAQLSLMDELIDEMDLTKSNNDDDEESTEAFKPKLTFNPYIQRLYQCLQHRALNPDDPLPELSPVVANYLKPPQEVITRCSQTMDKMADTFKLKYVAKRKAENGDDSVDDAPVETKLVKLDDDLGGGMSNLIKTIVKEVGTVSPVEDFKSMIADKEEDRFKSACTMMCTRILQIVYDSFGAQYYGKALDCIKALRDECCKNKEAGTFNKFLREVKEKMPTKGRKAFWEEIQTEKITLISKIECESSGVTVLEAGEFLAEKKPEKVEKPQDDEDEDADDLLAMM